MAKKNILIFGHGYATQFIDINNQYSQLFDKNDYEVTIAYLTGEPDQAIRARHLTDQIVFLNSAKKSVRGLKLDAIKKILQLCKEKKFEIVICHRYKPTYIMLCVAFFQRIPRIISVMHELGTLKSLKRRLTIALLARKNIFFAGVSDAVRNDIRKTIWRVPHDHIITLYNSIDIEATQTHMVTTNEARKKLKLPENAFVFATIGRLAKNKDQKTLIYAFNNIKNQCYNAKLIIIGDGELETELKNLVHSLNLNNNVIFTGFLAHASHYMRAFDVFVLSSIQEAFGMVLIEAMAAKIPVIATHVNGIPEVVGDAGILVEPNAVNKLAAEMLKAYQLEATELARWGNKGYERVVNGFSLEAFKRSFWGLL